MSQHSSKSPTTLMRVIEDTTVCPRYANESDRGYHSMKQNGRLSMINLYPRQHYGMFHKLRPIFISINFRTTRYLSALRKISYFLVLLSLGESGLFPFVLLVKAESSRSW